jgi:tetratricopeptide (TPR) repeat protein
MALVGRNDPCPCGSGKKYKKCCLQDDEAQARSTWIEPPRTVRPSRGGALAAMMAEWDRQDAEDYELAQASNAVVEMIRAGQLDEAEQAAHDLLRRYPEVHDGYDRLGMVHEARGDNAKAIDAYRQALDFVRQHPEDYDPEFEEVYLKLINRLDITLDKSTDAG